MQTLWVHVIVKFIILHFNFKKALIPVREDISFICCPYKDVRAQGQVQSSW